MTLHTTPEPALPATLIIGLGNSLRGDDGVGVRLAQMLAKQTFPDDVEVVDGGTQGLGLVPLLEGRQRVILVDAADIGQTPGEFRRFTLEEAVLAGDEQHVAIHAAGLREALLLATALKIVPDQVIIFGVQPARIDWHNGLSLPVEAALPELISAVVAEIEIRN
jgi:hydrogenase maturation protease